MPLTQQLLLSIPSPILGILMVVIGIMISIAGLLGVRRFISHQRLKTHNDVASAIFGTLGMMYAVLVAFVVVIAWEDFDRANLNVEKEASCLAALYRDSEGLSAPFKSQAQPLLNEYANAVINDEWKMLARGERSPKVELTVKNIWHLYSNYSPDTITEQIFFKETVKKLNELSEFRRQRLLDSRTGIHPVLWFVLIMGGMVTILFTFFFGSENLTAQIMMTGLLAALISLILFTILVFDFPFTGGVTISPEPFKQMLNF
jgi:hypothetical protein